MSSNAYTSAGTKIFLSERLPSDLSIDEFDILPYTEVGEVSDISEFGKAQDVLSYYKVGSDDPVKIKGNRSFNGFTLTMAAYRENEGQALLYEALQSKNSYSFQITVPEPDVYYFTAYVVEYNVNIGGPDQIVSSTMSLALTSDLIVDTDVLAI